MLSLCKAATRRSRLPSVGLGVWGVPRHGRLGRAEGVRLVCHAVSDGILIGTDASSGSLKRGLGFDKPLYRCTSME